MARASAGRRAKLIVPSVTGGKLPGRRRRQSRVCCFSEDMWQELDSRRLILPALFQVQGIGWLHTFSAGVDSPVFQVLIDRGTTLTNSSGASAPSIAQYVLAMMLHTVKRIDDWREQTRREWRRSAGAHGQTVGSIGTGAIGGESRAGAGVRMRVHRRARPRSPPRR
jgi:lactate dehydrogenase-like 2-hydroxyacid dehydrogenase